MELSLYLAKVFGIFFLIGGFALLLNKKTYHKADVKLLNNQPVTILFGMFVMLAALFLVMKHNIWELSYVGLITLIAWIAFAKGAIIVVIPDLLDVLRKKTFGNSWYVVGGVIWVVAGLYLTYHGFFV
ncbi:MAG: hypothetical protein COX81_00205 [Candidatus Magasanikbacteria bacterium CG_4_10_14_0_2_um_filter_37_12]|uniref:Integral membrane protein (PIN domain superfamily) n=1 Tax=Candidatus Magasanikbacteria bacterium CG_4_10_14_0_2_um_filter_37_12 TaxID=1974637 RepID=A0A2M7VAB5_9BACT|nr:MAG: hypothetical protein COX81_00205 [Candidatus Magasanikbacteria bacterium CG_4_10_14_0_2_um_filter_37_12]